MQLRWCAVWLALTLGLWSNPAVAAERDWRAERMSIGLRADRWSGLETETAPSKNRDNCRRWRAMATQLGETYAGYALRTSVLKRVCGFEEAERRDEAWGWPWDGLETGAHVPPRLHRTLGDWEIRCGSAGARRLCALLHRAAVPPDRALDVAEHAQPALVAHFVIDMIAGQERVLWRLFVPAEATAAGATPIVPTASAEPGVRPRAGRGEIRYRLGGSDHVELFPACARTGCLMEAHVQRAGAVATRLWDGKSVELSVARPSGEFVAVTLPGTGFRAAFSELVRLRRDETRWPARR